jgi:hypothetical protein
MPSLLRPPTLDEEKPAPGSVSVVVPEACELIQSILRLHRRIELVHFP